MAKFARAYADQTEADHATLVKAVRRGELPVTEGALQQTGFSLSPLIKISRSSASAGTARSPEHAKADHGDSTDAERADSRIRQPASNDAIGVG